MTQLDLLAPVRLPKKGTMEWDLLMALKSGEKLTPAVAYEKYDCLSLSQRIGEFKKSGWPILTEMVTVHSGKKVAMYWMEAA